eukprot:346157-Pyramimonas_sp.AAC.1
MVGVEPTQVPTESGECVGELDPRFVHRANQPPRNPFLVYLAQGVLLSGVEARWVERRVPSNGAHPPRRPHER